MSENGERKTEDGEWKTLESAPQFHRDSPREMKQAISRGKLRHPDIGAEHWGGGLLACFL